MQIQFYILEPTSTENFWHFICYLLEIEYQAKRSVYVLTNTKDISEKLDHLLWTFREDSFIPHAQQNNLSGLPIMIGENDPIQVNYDVLLNTTANIPPFFQRFAKVMEIVPNDPDMQQQARRRYRQYREQNFPTQTIRAKMTKPHHYELNQNLSKEEK